MIAEEEVRKLFATDKKAKVSSLYIDTDVYEQIDSLHDSQLLEVWTVFFNGLYKSAHDAGALRGARWFKSLTLLGCRVLFALFLDVSSSPR